MPEEVQCQEEAQGRHGSSPSSCPHVPVGPILQWECQWDLETRRKEEPPNLRLHPSPDPRIPDLPVQVRVRALPGCRAGHLSILRTVLAQSRFCKRQS